MCWKVRIFQWVIITSMVMLTGCGTVLDQVQKTIGNRISVVDDHMTDSDDDGEESPKKEWVNPRPYHQVEQILTDPGEGKYSGSLYDQQKVFQAIDQMPKGLSEEKLYAYLLGLVGENYNKEYGVINEVAQVNYQQSYQELQRRWQPRNIKKVNGKLPKKVNLVILLDASNSMADMVDKKTKWQLTQEISLKMANSAPPGSSIFVRSYGARSKDKSLSCQKTDALFRSPLYQGAKQGNQLKSVMGKIHPSGWSPLTVAMKDAERDFSKMKNHDQQTENILFIVTDNGETCQGDPIAIAKKWRDGPLKIRTHILGMRITGRKESQLQKIAELTFGHYENARNERDFLEMMKLNLEDINQINLPWQFRLSDYLARKYRADRGRLTYHYLKMNQKIDREYDRLKKALGYARDKKKIDGRDWVRLSAFTTDRYKQVNEYAEHRLLDIDGELLEGFTKQSNQLSQSWQNEGKKKIDYDNHQKKRVRIPL
ncbi:von Willebrand factor type A domain-containing protein [Seinonella peptonophila]|uniref:von Willebrand factor type A domain-containing protein n=1 Tax=Seinonella peptonophila TaxID=112248 RepID=A0A1M4VQZ2_9BACL|nr:VWA domain-containing protein [Seinonella peptonophila]SHE71521.1 von Willebrand factor type A domain-containing protein [Seinonella peptonophila]